MRPKTLFFLPFIALSLISRAQSNYIGSGTSLDFDGSQNTYIDLGDVFNTLEFPFSFEAWVKPTSYPPIWGGIFGSDNDVAIYHGFWIRVAYNGQLQIEFGDGQGSGQQFRNGKQTNDILSLNKWTHIAIVCNDISDIHIYFNGVDESLSTTDGGSSNTTLTHSEAPASIGRILNAFDESDFAGQLDEIRLWNIARNTDDIRNNMCQKLTGTEDGLIGYWTADESYSSETVLDKTVPAENGSIVGSVGKLTSGAPIGDVSTNLFTSNWTGITMSLSSPGNDMLFVKNILQKPNGIFIYRVDDAPYYKKNLKVYPDYYFGVFTVDGAQPAMYTLIYNYSFDNGVVNASNEKYSTLFAKSDGSRMSWTNTRAVLKSSSDKLILTSLTLDGEFIFNIKSPSLPERELLSSIPDQNDIIAYPNPFNNHLTIGSNMMNQNELAIFNEHGENVFDIKNENKPVSINTSEWSSGIYLVKVITESGIVSSRKIILSR